MPRVARKHLFVLSLLIATILLTVPLTGTAAAGNPRDFAGAVYTMTNDASGNAVIMFRRTAHGLLVPGGTFFTEGLGSGDGLGNQGALALSTGNRWLFVVNPGSNDVSVFRVEPGGLTFVDREPSGGQRPISVTVDRDLLYVLNAGGAVGGSDTITALVVSPDGSLSPLAGSTRVLSAGNTGPAQVSFSPDGRFLAVTEKATNLVDTWHVGSNGLASNFVANLSEGATPFGFAFGKRDLLIVSEAAGGAADASSMSSYVLEDDGTLQAVSSAVPTTETAACWVVVTNDGRFAYTTNAGSGSVSGYRIAFDGTITLLDANGVTGNTGSGSVPLDMALSNNGRHLFTLNSGNNTIGAFRVHADGSLSHLPGASGIPAGANGLAAR
jgi:6-phosphogluconolactonase (cycloisomerase 2 family)